MTPRYFEDFIEGEKLHTQAVTVTESMIVDFAMLYDPQPIHMDKAGSEAGDFGSLIASGWQVGALAFRMVVQSGYLFGGMVASPGLDNVRWPAPVRPGDTIRTVGTVSGARPSRSRPDSGVVKLDYEVRNQRDEVVMTWTGIQVVRRRPEI